jgi:hypothetical protein
MRPRLGFAAGVADRDLSVARLAPAAARRELLDHLRFRSHTDEAVADSTRERGDLVAVGGDVQLRRFGRQRVQPRLLDGEVGAAMTLLAALPQQADHFDRFLEHLQAHGPFRPRIAVDVLVQVLAGADAEEEAPGHQRRRRRRRLRDDRRMDPPDRTRDAGAEPQPAGRLAIAPIVHQTIALCPCLSTHGWK